MKALTVSVCKKVKTASPEHLVNFLPICHLLQGPQARTTHADPGGVALQ